MPDKLRQIENDLQQLKLQLTRMERPKEYVFEKDVRLAHLTAFRGGIFPGVVGSGGTATYLPEGWTSAKDSTGKYTVTHNLGTSRYSVTITALNASNPVTASLTALSSTAFSLNTYSAGNFDAAFYFQLQLY